VTYSKTYLPELDGLRFLAISATLLFHVFQFMPAYITGTARSPSLATSSLVFVLRSGSAGVPLFFIISGFILALPFARNDRHLGPPVAIRSFFQRRLTRLEPPYVLSLLAFYFIRLAFRSTSAPPPAPGHLISGLFYLHWLFYGAENGMGNPVNMVAWSLEIEIQFYLLVPLLVRLFLIAGKARRRAAMLTIILGSIAAQYAALLSLGTIARRLWDLSMLSYFHYFLAGLLFVDLYLDEDLAPVHRTYAWDLLLLVATLSTVAVYGHPMLATLVIPISLTMAFAAAFLGRITSAFLRLPWIATIGGMCYSIYLLHYGLLRAFARLSDKLFPHLTRFGEVFALQCLVKVPVIFAICAAFYLLIERPCMDHHWPHKLWSYLSRSQRLSDFSHGPKSAPELPPDLTRDKALAVRPE
jgi:peptidoglycan/LPS O-acetylase OafA/YrhL